MIKLKGKIELKRFENLVSHVASSDNFYKLEAKGKYLFIGSQMEISDHSISSIGLEINIEDNNFAIKPILVIDSYTSVSVKELPDTISDRDIDELYKDFFYSIQYEANLFNFDDSIVPFLEKYLDDSNGITYPYAEKISLDIKMFDNFIIKGDCHIGYYNNIIFTDLKITDNNDDENVFVELPDISLYQTIELSDEEKEEKIIESYLETFDDNQLLDMARRALKAYIKNNILSRKE